MWKFHFSQHGNDRNALPQIFSIFGNICAKSNDMLVPQVSTQDGAESHWLLQQASDEVQLRFQGPISQVSVTKPKMKDELSNSTVTHTFTHDFNVLNHFSIRTANGVYKITNYKSTWNSKLSKSMHENGNILEIRNVTARAHVRPSHLRDLEFMSCTALSPV